MNESTAPGKVTLPHAAPARGRLRRWIRPLLLVPTPAIFLAAAALACLVLWRQGGLAQIGSSLREVSPWALLAILVAYAASVLVLAWRWHLLARMAGGAPAWGASAEVFLTSVIVNYAAPVGLAVPTRAALSVRDLGLTAGQSAAVVGWELGLDVVALLLITLFWLAVGGGALLQSVAIDRTGVVAAVAAVAAAATAVGAIVLVAPLRTRVVKLLRPMVVNPLRSAGHALGAVALTALFWSVQTAIMGTLLSVFGVTPTPPLLLGVMGLPILIGMLSPVPGGAGVREALMGASARLDGVAAGPVVLAAITYRLTLFVVTPVAWGVVRVVRTVREGR